MATILAVAMRLGRLLLRMSVTLIVNASEVRARILESWGEGGDCVREFSSVISAAVGIVDRLIIFFGGCCYSFFGGH